MKSCFLILTILLLFSCKKQPAPFSQFDKIEYYHTDINQDGITALFNRKAQLSKDDKDFWDIFFKYHQPRSVNDEQVIAVIKRLYKVQGTIDEKYYKAIADIFSDHEINDYMIACEPQFRNILIFKKDNKVTGILKICFGCEKRDFIGSDKNTVYFGAKGYKKLKNIVTEQMNTKFH